MILVSTTEGVPVVSVRRRGRVIQGNSHRPGTQKQNIFQVFRILLRSVKGAGSFKSINCEGGLFKQALAPDEIPLINPSPILLFL